MANDILVKVGADISDFSRKMQESSRALGRFMDANNKTFDSFSKTGKAVTGFGMAVTGGLGVAAKQAIDFESSFAGVRKTIDASEKEFAILEQGIRDMAKELPASVHEINEVAEAAGQLGIKKENILDFTRTMIDLGEATNMTSDEAATSFARFANIVGMSQQDFDKLGSVVVELGNNFATTESEIVAMGMRLAGVGNQVGMTESDIMALATSMSSVGIEAEAGGTAMSMALKKMQNAVSNGGKELDNFAKAAGMSSQEFADAFKKDPVQALDSFIKGLDESGRKGENLNEILKSVGITGIRESDTLLRLAGASDILSDAVDMASNAWVENTALSDEASQRYETLESKLSILKNTIIDAGISLGSALMPKIESITEIIRKLVEGFNNLDDSTKENIAKFTALAGAVVLVMGPLFLLVGAIPSIINGFRDIANVVKGIGMALIWLTSPAGIITMGLITSAVLIIKYWEPIKEFFGKISGTFGRVSDVIKNKFNDSLSRLIEFSIKSVEAVRSLASELTGKLSKSAVKATKSIKGGLTSSLSFVGSAVGKVVKLFSELASVVGSRLSPLIDTVVDNFRGIGNAISKTFEGDLSGVIDLFKQFAPTIIGLLLGGLPGIVFATARYMPAIAEGIEKYLPTIVEVITKVINTFVETITKLLPEIINIGVQLINKLVDGLVEGLPVIVEGISFVLTTFIDYITEFIPALIDIGIELVNNLIEGVLDSLPIIIDAALSLVTVFIDSVLESIPRLIDVGVDVINALLEGVVESVPVILGAGLLLVTTLVGAIFENIPVVFDAGLSIITEVINGVLSLLPTLINAGLTIVITIVDTLISNLPKIIEAGVSILMSVVDGILEALPKLIKLAIELILKIASTIIGNLPKIIEAGVQILISIVSGILKALPKLISTIVKLIVQVASTVITNLPKIIKAGGEILLSLIKGIVSMVGTLLTSIYSDVIQPLLQEFKNIDLSQIGKDIIQGLINGIGSMATAVWDKAKSIGNSIADGIKGVLGIKSPSRVMMSLGKWTSIGLAEGIEDYAKYVDKASDRLAESAVPDVRSIDMSYNTPAGVRGTLASAVRGTVDVDTRDDRLVRAIGSLERRLTNLEVVMDGRSVGKIVEPHVTELQDINKRRSGRWR